MVDKNAHYLMCKGGVYYFTRHVPNDLQKHYETPRIVICLKTRSKNAALKASRSIAAKLDDFWLQLSHFKCPLAMVRPICDLPPFSESLRDSESHLNVHPRGHAGPHGGCGYYIHVLFNRWGEIILFRK